MRLVAPRITPRHSVDLERVLARPQRKIDSVQHHPVVDVDDAVEIGQTQDPRDAADDGMQGGHQCPVRKAGKLFTRVIDITDPWRTQPFHRG